jgi:hypothetical protein
MTSPDETFDSRLNDRFWPRRIKQLKRFVTGFAVSGWERTTIDYL